MLRRLSILLACTLFLGLAAEGVLSLLLQRSFGELWKERDDSLEELIAERLSLEAALTERAAKTPGPYRVHEDPYVGYAFKQDAEIEYAEKRIRTDALGLRVRPGPPPGPDPFRILFLGDSVAFGHGLDDGEVIAAQVESLLREVRAADAREVVSSTVAVPSWNYRNIVRFLLDHIDLLDPDVVLYMDIDNDLDDSYAADEIGQRRLMEDPGSPDPLLNFRTNRAFFNHAVFRLREEGRALDPDSFGPLSHQAGLSFSSTWRLDDMARALEDLALRLAARGARFALLPYVQHPTHRQVRARLVRLGAEVPSIPLLEEIRDEDTLGTDPHPNAVAERAFAIWTAATLLERGWVPGQAIRELPQVASSFAGRRTRELSDEEVAEWSERFEAEARAKLERTVSGDSLQGMLQIYGGLNVDGSFGPRLAAVLPSGRALRVTLGPFGERPDLYPLEIEVEVDRKEVGTLAIPGADAGPITQEYALPPECGDRPYEVVLKSERWCVYKVLVVAARFVSFESIE